MAVDFANIITTDAKKTKSSSESSVDLSNSKKATTKDKPSLFDSLLTNAKKEVSDDKASSKKKESKKIESEKTVDVNKEEVKQKATNTVKVSSLSKVVLDSKVKESSTEDKKINKEINTNKETKIEPKVDEEVSSKKEELKDTVKVVDNKVEQKVLAKEVKESNTEDKKINKEINTNKETKIEPKVDEEVSSKKEELKDTVKVVDNKVVEKITETNIKDVSLLNKEIVEVQNDKPVSLLENMISNLSIINEVENKSDKTVDNKTNMQANMFLSSQKNSKDLENIQKLVEGKKVLTESKTTSGVQKSAEILELDATDIEVEKSEEKGTKTEILKKDVVIPSVKVSSNILDKLGVIKDHFTNIITKNDNQTSKVITTSSKIVEEPKETIEVTVPSSVAQTIQSRIIGARQKLGSFMSEVARNMAQNYRPPVTAFRMNLNPANLGTIAIIMKSNKADGGSLNISMNMSSSNTLESFVDNKQSLQNSLQKSLGDVSSNISLDFGMQSDSSNQSFEEQQQESKKQLENGNPIDEISNEAIEEDTQSYM